ncbi:MAG: hypothetical protein NZ992_06750 [Candidatus Korarchaeum sp.]|nr:hypothetical protein [Candidatus Korarchaeum sp.]MDW8035698.1 hypothetical protein [Candidatus Korarchaeum sp.]
MLLSGGTLRVLAALTVLLLVVPLAAVYSCPPTAGYVGAIYKQGSDLSGLIEFLKEAGISASISFGEYEFSPYSDLKFKSVFLRIGAYEEGGELKAYVFPGRSYTLLIVETDVNLSDAPLIYAESLLSPYLDPKLIVNVSGSLNNRVPPVPLAKWYELERGEPLSVSVYKCGFTFSKMKRPKVDAVAVVSNSIDYDLSFNMIRDAFESRGVRVNYLGSDVRAIAKAKDYSIVIFLGGNRAIGIGSFVAPVLGNVSIKDQVIVMRPWATGGLAVVVAGIDRYATRGAAGSFAKGMVDDVIRFLRGGEAIKKVVTRCGPVVELISSSGRCGYQEEPSLIVKVEGNFAYANYSLSYANPCGRLVLSGYEMHGNRISVSLRIVDTSEICVQCIGVLEAELKIGPLQEGSYELCINKLCKNFEVKG